MATSAELVIYRGDSYPITFTLLDATTGLPLDLTGYAFVLTAGARENPDDDSTKLFSVAGAVADPESGQVSFTPLAEDTATAGSYFYDVQMTNDDGYVRTVVKSVLLIRQNITK